MRAIDYAIREALASFRRRRTASAFAIGAIALAVTVPGALLLLTWNAERVVARWSSVAEFSVDLRDDGMVAGCEALRHLHVKLIELCEGRYDACKRDSGLDAADADGGRCGYVGDGGGELAGVARGRGFAEASTVEDDGFAGGCGCGEIGRG